MLIPLTRDCLLRFQHDKSRNAVRSSLSKIAHSFVRAYSESQRSHILNLGRTLLVNTDYHNSVQVGMFAPPPSDEHLNTLGHLDGDPLSTFPFQRCSISTTAQKLLNSSDIPSIKPYNPPWPKSWMHFLPCCIVLRESCWICFGP